jgi:hypothetical protein
VADPGKQIVTWRDFKGGEYGTLHGLDAPPNSFTGRNVVVFRDGSIGPRCGLRDVTPTGQSNGVIHAMGYTGIPGNETWYAQGTSVYQFGSARSSAYTGSFGGTPSKASAVFDNRYVLVDGVGAYKLDHVNKTVTSLTSPAGRAIAAFGSRVFIANQSGLPNRVRYSKDADDTTWTVGAGTGDPGSFDVGLSAPIPAEEIRGLYPFRDFLLIVKANGELWVLTTNGDPTTTGTLRRVSTRQSGGAVFNSYRGAMIYGNEFWSIGLNSTAPHTYTGGRLRSLPHLGSEIGETGAWATSLPQTDDNPPNFAIVGLSQDSVFAVSANKGLLRRNNAWTKHEYGVTVVGYAADATLGAVILTDGGGASAKPNFYFLNTASERPPIKSGAESVGDASDTAPSCDLTLPVWRDGEGRRVMVKHVFVTFRKYATGVSATNHFDLTVRAEYGLDNSGDAASATQSFDEAASSGSSSGVRAQQRFGFGDQSYAESFQLEFTNLRGVAIDKVVAVLETEPLLA